MVSLNLVLLLCCVLPAIRAVLQPGDGVSRLLACALILVDGWLLARPYVQVVAAHTSTLGLQALCLIALGAAVVIAVRLRAAIDGTVMVLASALLALIALRIVVP